MKNSNREHAFDIYLAEIVGIEKAILLKNFEFWVSENRRRKLKIYQKGETWWTVESLTSLAKKYPYMKRGNLSRWLNELHADCWIRLHKGEKNENWYSTGLVFEAWDAGQDWVQVFQNETGRCFKMKQQVFQNETDIPEKVFQNETHNNSENTDVESNSETLAPTGAAFRVQVFEMKEETMMLGVPANETVLPAGANNGPKVTPIVHRMIETFETEHKKNFTDADGKWIGYVWAAKEFKALQQLADKLAKSFKTKRERLPTDDETISSFSVFLEKSAKVDNFVIQNWFSPALLNSHYQDIVNKIHAVKPSGPQRQGPRAFGGDATKYSEKQAF